MHWMARHITEYRTKFQSGTQWDLQIRKPVGSLLQQELPEVNIEYLQKETCQKVFWKELQHQYPAGQIRFSKLCVAG